MDSTRTSKIIQRHVYAEEVTVIFVLTLRLR